jgi:hypothetical protein
MRTPLLLWRIGAALLPAATGVLGVINGTNDWEHAETVSQYLAGAGVLLYTPLGIAAAIALLMGHRLARPILAAWAIVVVFEGGIAPVAWGNAPVTYGIISGIGSAMLIAAVVWAGAQAVPEPAEDSAP